MKPKFTKEEIEKAGNDLVFNQSLIKIISGALLGLLIGVIIYLGFAMVGATFTLLLFAPPFIVGFLAGVMGKPYDFKYKLIICIFGMVTYFIGLYFIFIAHNSLLILFTPIAGFISVYCSSLHISEVQKRAIWKMQYE